MANPSNDHLLSIVVALAWWTYACRLNPPKSKQSAMRYDLWDASSWFISGLPKYIMPILVAHTRVARRHYPHPELWSKRAICRGVPPHTAHHNWSIAICPFVRAWVSHLNVPPGVVTGPLGATNCVQFELRAALAAAKGGAAEGKENVRGAE